MSRTTGAANFGRRSRKPEWLAEIERINRLALAVGLSYGRYVAKYGDGRDGSSIIKTKSASC